MKNELTKKRFFTGLIAGIVMIALLAGLEIAEPKKATGQAAEPPRRRRSAKVRPPRKPPLRRRRRNRPTRA